MCFDEYYAIRKEEVSIIKVLMDKSTDTSRTIVGVLRESDA
jgi:hypothetical protein